jgi:hypothetical protein
MKMATGINITIGTIGRGGSITGVTGCENATPTGWPKSERSIVAAIGTMIGTVTAIGIIIVMVTGTITGIGSIMATGIITAMRSITITGRRAL